VLVFLIIGAAACGDSSADGDSMTVDLQEQNGSGVPGTATLEPTSDGNVKVTLDIDGAPDVAQPAHIHTGTCDDLDPTPKFPLANVEGGTSETTIDVALDELTASHHAVNVHMSEEDVETYAACGDITG
jgi:hypothetical protein